MMEEVVEISEEEKKQKLSKESALKEKEAGNAAYKKKNFDKAIEHYTKAMELWDEDITFLTNRAGQDTCLSSVGIKCDFSSCVFGDG